MNRFYYNKVLANKLLERKEEQFNEVKGEVEILILGDSHAQGGLNASLIDNSFNMAVGSEIYFGDYHKLEKILKSPSQKINTIILPFDLTSFFSERWGSFLSEHLLGNSWYWADYISFSELSATGEILPAIKMKINSYFPFTGDWVGFISGKKNYPPLLMGHRSPPIKKKPWLIKGEADDRANNFLKTFKKK